MGGFLNFRIGIKKNPEWEFGRLLKNAMKSNSWRITKPLRAITDSVRGKNIRTDKVWEGKVANQRDESLIRKGLRSIKTNGILYTGMRILCRKNKAYSIESSLWMRRHRYTEQELQFQKNREFNMDITFSFLVPLYNTPSAYLKEMIDSIISQTYDRWELCLADGSDSGHPETESICKEYAKKDIRIKYQKMDKNLGISENTNAALRMAQGEYVALIDHDDILSPAALYEVMDSLSRQDADLIYTDEMVFLSPEPEHVIRIAHKQDFSIYNLRAQNFMNHFTVFRRALVEKTGGYRTEYNGSQDHDMMLRIAGITDKIVHLPKVLYYWRAYAQSVALNPESKPYAREAAIRAVEDSLRAEKITIRADGAWGPVCVNYIILGNPLVSIIIFNVKEADDCSECIQSIENRTSYDRTEIITVRPMGNPVEEIKPVKKRKKIQDKNHDDGIVAAINETVRNKVQGEFILLLDSRTEIIEPNWIEEMLMYAQRSDVGVVGAMLYRMNDTIWHAGMTLGMDGTAGNNFDHFYRGESGYSARLMYAQELTAVSWNCMMIRKDVWEKAGGLDPQFALSLGDVDLCMRVREKGYKVIWTPHAELYQYFTERIRQPKDHEHKKRLALEKKLFQCRWQKELRKGDPFYNPNLTLSRSDFSLAWSFAKREKRIRKNIQKEK